MTLAEAKALLPQLQIEEADPEADRRELDALAEWAQAFSPIVQIDPPDTLLLDVTGCQRLFKGDRNLLHRALTGLLAEGFSTRGAVAGTPGAAWAIAHTHDDYAVVTPPGRDVEILSRLPVSSLRIDGPTVKTLQSVGVETIEALLHLPRSSLATRFGDALLRRLDQALGNVPEPLTPFAPPPVLRASVRLGAATDRRDLVRQAVDHVLTQFCEQLSCKAAGITRLYVTFHHPETTPTTFPLDVSRPTRSFKRLTGLLDARLDQVHLPAATDGVIIWSRQAEPLGDRQGMLFETDEPDGEEIADLVDRLSVRLGSRSVVRVTLESDHQPERAYAYAPCVNTSDRTKTASSRRRRQAHSQSKARANESEPPKDPPPAGTRPLRVWAKPVKVPVMAVFPDGPPRTFRFASTEHVVAACTGPERMETGWWRGPHIQRDYYRVLTQTGQAFWLFRDKAKTGWYIHGVFD